ncbi:MAG: hypothetical protein M1336_07155 [Deltaproteobacteria bacterium]|nr:hypothetical protein [Deltaproteobacteria bacterium]
MNTKPELPGSTSVAGHEPRSLELSPAQKRLRQALHEKDPSIALWYEGALWTLSDGQPPDRMAQAAHGFREVMEKLPRRVDLPQEEEHVSASGGQNLKGKVQGLSQAYARLKRIKGDGRLLKRAWDKFVEELEAFFQWFTSQRPSRREAARRAFRNLDPHPLSLPEALEDRNLNEWAEMHEFFELTSHHTLSPSSDKFAHWQRVLETFLLERLVPRTFEDEQAIDSLVQRAVKP